MTENTIKSITADGITGMIFALEGLKRTIVLLNGPMGCKFYHSSTSGYLTERPVLYLPAGKEGKRVPVDYNYLNDWFFRQERVPCTYLDGYDYVYGTKEKVREAIHFLKNNIDFDLLGIVNSPGAALIGDNLLHTAREILGEGKVVMLESPGYSTSFEEGCSEAERALLVQTGSFLWGNSDVQREEPPEAGCSCREPASSEKEEKSPEAGCCCREPVSSVTEEKSRKKVNIFGISIWHRYFEGDIKELKRLLRMCDIDVTCVLCADCSLEEMKAMKAADLSIVLYPETGLEAAAYLEKCTGIPVYCCEMPPIGFSATEKIIRDICRILGSSCDRVMEESGRLRARVYRKIKGIYQMYGKPKGVPFYVSGEGSLKKAYTSFLTAYLGMKETDMEKAELVFSDANVISELKIRGCVFCGIEIAFPGMGYVDITVKTHMGLEGACFLVEQVLNGLMSNL